MICVFVCIIIAIIILCVIVPRLNIYKNLSDDKQFGLFRFPMFSIFLILLACIGYYYHGCSLMSNMKRSLAIDYYKNNMNNLESSFNEFLRDMNYEYLIDDHDGFINSRRYFVLFTDFYQMKRGVKDAR